MYQSKDLSIRDGKAELEHSCDEWEIGGPAEVRQMIADLTHVAVLIESGVKDWLHPDKVAERAEQARRYEEIRKERGL